MEDVELPLNFTFKCKNQGYYVVIRQFLFGQYRLQLVKRNALDGDIVREACTYDLLTAIGTRDAICAADIPEAYMESLATKDNCEYQGGRIRLDNGKPT